MRWARLAAGALLIVALAGATSAVPTKTLPPGVGRDVTERSCLICHSAMLITQQHKDSTGWEKTVSLMQKWGAPVEGAARDSLMTYLRGHFFPLPQSHVVR